MTQPLPKPLTPERLASIRLQATLRAAAITLRTGAMDQPADGPEHGYLVALADVLTRHADLAKAEEPTQ